MDDAEFRRQERTLMRLIGVCFLAFALGMALWLYNEHSGNIVHRALPPAQQGP
jgi:hypothetical protein